MCLDFKKQIPGQIQRFFVLFFHFFIFEISFGGGPALQLKEQQAYFESKVTESDAEYRRHLTDLQGRAAAAAKAIEVRRRLDGRGGELF